VLVAILQDAASADEKETIGEEAADLVGVVCRHRRRPCVLQLAQLLLGRLLQGEVIDTVGPRRYHVAKVVVNPVFAVDLAFALKANDRGISRLVGAGQLELPAIAPERAAKLVVGANVQRQGALAEEE